MDPKELTEFDIQRFENEIARFNQSRTNLLGAGWGCICGGLTLMIIFIVLFINQDVVYFAFVVFYLLIYLSVFIIAGGVVCLILRTALYSKRINNRRNLINEARRYQEYKQSLEEDK